MARIESEFDAIVIGGGPAGAVASLALAQADYSVCLVERRAFPRETLCGEFLSHEVIDILRDLGIEQDFLSLGPSPITKFALCPERGLVVSESLGFTAYGLRRGAFDQFLLNAAIKRGVHVLQPAEAEAVVRREEGFDVRCRLNDSTQALRSRWCIGAYGKTSTLDKQLQRPFAGMRTQMNGVKFHVPSASLVGMNTDEIRIFTGPRMYCGVNQVDGETSTICFLERRTGYDVSPRERLRQLAAANKHFAEIAGARVMSAIDVAPIYGTGNIYFGSRNVVERGIFMVGDAARVIWPLAGDGIGMALQSGRLIGRLFSEHRHAGTNPLALETEYRKQWKRMFGPRLRAAATLQRILFSNPLRALSTTLLSISPSLLRLAIGTTRADVRHH